MYMDASQDRRVAARWRARQEAVGDIKNLGLARVGRGFPLKAEDVSATGARVRSAVRLEPGDRVRLAFPSDKVEQPALSVEGEIVWVRKPKLVSLGKWVAGVSFAPESQPDIPPLVERSRRIAGMYHGD